MQLWGLDHGSSVVVIIQALDLPGAVGSDGALGTGQALNLARALLQGEDQKKLDVISNEIFCHCLRASGRTGVLASEEEDLPVAVEQSYSGAPAGRLVGRKADELCPLRTGASLRSV